MSSSTTNKDTLLATAVAAAAAGAAIAYTAIKLSDKKDQSKSKANDPSEGRAKKKTLICNFY